MNEVIACGLKLIEILLQISIHFHTIRHVLLNAIHENRHVLDQLHELKYIFPVSGSLIAGSAQLSSFCVECYDGRVECSTKGPGDRTRLFVELKQCVSRG